jgi:Membrane dipeptidase (Peptidase family M19)
MNSTLLPVLVFALVHSALCDAKDDPKPENATVAVLRAFEAHDIVLIGEIHSNKQEYNWYRSLVTTPEFADRVDDIVLEMGNSLYQESVDRYVRGEAVPLEDVQKAWRNTVGLVGPQSPLVAELYRAVRETNIGRRGNHQMRILCGDPSIDWDAVKDMKCHSVFGLPEPMRKKLYSQYKASYGFREKQDIDGVDHPKRTYDLAEGLIRRGYSDANIELILGGNFQHVLT